jgi:purine-binding chemotaxis protein CheW
MAWTSCAFSRSKGWDRATPIPNTPDYIKGVINPRGTVVPIVDLRRCFGLEQIEDGSTTVIMVLKVNAEKGERTMGLVVDAVSDVFTVEKSQLKPPSDFAGSGISAFIRALVTVNGRMVILLDIDKRVATDIESATAAASTSQERAKSALRQIGRTRSLTVRLVAIRTIKGLATTTGAYLGASKLFNDQQTPRAVVAAEVLKLAQRLAGAAKEIKSLIKGSVERVEEGSRLVNDSGSTVQEIVDSVKSVSEIIAEIAAASEKAVHRHRAGHQDRHPDGSGGPTRLHAGRAGGCRQQIDAGTGSGPEPADGLPHGVASNASSAPVKKRRASARPCSAKASAEPVAASASKRVVGGDDWQEF